MELDSDESEFPIYQLDYVSLNEIYKNLDLTDIFELSFTTDEIRRTLRDASVPVNSILIDFDPTYPSVHLKAHGSEFLWTFGYPERFNMSPAGEFKIRQFKYSCKKSDFGYHTEHFDVEHGMLAVIRHLVTIFNCADSNIEELSIDLGVIEDCRSVCEHFTKFKNIDRLAIHQSVDIERNKLNFAQNFDWIMSNLKIKEIYVGVKIMEHKMVQKRDGDFEIRSFAMRFDKVLNVNHICLRHAEWVTAEDLVKLNVETAILIENRLTDEDLNTFIKHWLNSTSNRLYWLEVRVSGKEFNRDAIMNDLETEADTYKLQNSKCSCPYRRLDTTKSVPFEFPESSLKVTRPNSSTFATIAITKETFFFHVKNDGPITIPVHVDVEENNERALHERIRLLDMQRIEADFLRHRVMMEREREREREERMNQQNRRNNEDGEVLIDIVRIVQDREREAHEARMERIDVELEDLRLELRRLQQQRRRQRQQQRQVNVLPRVVQDIEIVELNIDDFFGPNQ